MLFMMMHKHDKSIEAGGRPSPEFIAAMGAFIGSIAQSGAMKDGAGLGKSVTRTRVTFQKGERTVLEGPYSGKNELVAAYLQLTVKSRAEAVEWASKLGRILGDCELEVGKTTEAWDLGLEPEPANPPLHYLVLAKATPASEAGTAPSADVQARVAALHTEMTTAGVLTSKGTLAPSKSAARIHIGRGKRSIVDGPFTESKELVGGFVLVDLPSREAAIELAWKYSDLMMKSVETLELDIRPALAP